MGREGSIESQQKSDFFCSESLPYKLGTFSKERSWLGDGYIQRTGFLPLAEQNDIVMLFPQVNYTTYLVNYTTKFQGWLEFKQYLMFNVHLFFGIKAASPFSLQKTIKSNL